VVSNLIRVHTPSTLTGQETYKSTRAAAVKKKVELEDSVEPILQKFLDFIILVLHKLKKL
jgi:type IV pilus assembly protein PilQ